MVSAPTVIVDKPRPTGGLRADQVLFLAGVATIPAMRYLGFSLAGYIYLADAFFALSAATYVVAVWRGRAQLRIGLFYIGIGTYLAAIIVSTVASSDIHSSAFKLPIELYVLSLAVLAYNQIRSVADLRLTFKAWMAGTAVTVIVGLVGIVLFYAGVSDFDNAGYGSLPPGPYPRIPGLFLNFNMDCNYLSVSLLIALAMVQVGWFSRRVALILAATLTVAAAFTVSPGLGGLLLGIGSWYYILWRERRPTFARSALTLGIVAALLFFAATLVSPVHTGQQHVSIPLLRRTFEPSSRLLCWQSAHATWAEHPVFGEGSGLPVPCPAYLSASGDVQHLQDAHNVYLNIAATKGTVGLLAFVLIAWMVLQRSLPLRLDGSPAAVIATTLALCFIEAFLYQGLSSSFEHTRHLWILTGMLAATCEMRRHNLAA